MKNFLKTLYFGDRGCEKLEMLDDKIIVQIDCISRTEPGSDQWNYYTGGDIYHGQLVFEGVIDFKFNPGLIPNDYFDSLDLVEEKDDCFLFRITGTNVTFYKPYTGSNVEIDIRCKDFYILDPQTGEKIKQ